MKENMFCFQCQETAKGTGCTVKGVCGKMSSTSAMMDMLLFSVRGIAIVANTLRNGHRKIDEKINRFIVDALFTTITNANFDDQRIIRLIRKGMELRNELINQARQAGIPLPETDELQWQGTEEEYTAKASQVGVLRETDENLRSLKELTLYGLKGMAAYTEHAMHLGFNDESIHTFMQQALSDMTTQKLTVPELTQLVLETGKYGVSAMALLDKANTQSYGNPEITKVDIGVRSNPGILISGHDLKDLEELLEQTEGTGVDVYTHSEMLPAHYYPAFKNTATSPVITGIHGGVNGKNSRHSTVRFTSRQIASFPRCLQLPISTGCIPEILPDIPDANTFRKIRMATKTFRRLSRKLKNARRLRK